MASNNDCHESVADSDFNGHTIFTPPSTIIADENYGNKDNQCSHHSSSVPWPNFTYLIRASSSGRLLTLDSGGVTLAKPGDNRGSSIHFPSNSGNASKSKDGSIFRTLLPVVFWGTRSGAI
ncbi:hypothetical protein BcDW1_5254 [Botrytis cinerea BcDW1]|uniref:Uncharacterized protein n=1 Tax=Botryotinia fuckeliana (strain BcDW1) TaxID=1290391 RepID=M7TXQ1_BOTF1|nr:hypothetical protein BcDW1_5254 [Botrytis cinerea BcDW1]